MKNKLFIGLAVVILIGIIVIAAFGFNVDYTYKHHSLIDINIGKEFNVSDIKAITDEVFGKEKVEIHKAGTYSDKVVIKVKSVSDEQKVNLNNKINEKYGIKNEVDDVQVNKISSFKLRDVAKSYAIPLAITTVLILIYMAVRYRKIGAKKVVLQTLLFTVLAELLYGALIAIVRYPVNRLVLPGAVVIYVAIITVLTAMFEKQVSIEEK
ncbi:MAG: hypothetical protein IJ690_04815 [Clostridia bacterium]|nr:hypothetical protein [Clostridia bacterium]